jgi:hypothetical protein
VLLALPALTHFRFLCYDSKVMREILLTRGYVALVDDADYERVMAVGPWYADVQSHTVYARRRGEGMLHRFIMGVADPKIWVDHWNHNGLHNWQTNLRVCNNSTNQRNRKGSYGKSPYKGVVWNTHCSKWQAHIFLANKKDKYLGVFVDEKEAALCYDRAAREHFGEFCHCNFPLESNT